MYYLPTLVHRREIRVHIAKQKIKKTAIKLWWWFVIVVDLIVLVPILLAQFGWYGAFNALINAICRACGY